MATKKTYSNKCIGVSGKVKDDGKKTDILFWSNGNGQNNGHIAAVNTPNGKVISYVRPEGPKETTPPVYDSNTSSKPPILDK